MAVDYAILARVLIKTVAAFWSITWSSVSLPLFSLQTIVSLIYDSYDFEIAGTKEPMKLNSALLSLALTVAQLIDISEAPCYLHYINALGLLVDLNYKEETKQASALLQAGLLMYTAAKIQCSTVAMGALAVFYLLQIFSPFEQLISDKQMVIYLQTGVVISIMALVGYISERFYRSTCDT